MQQGVRVRIHRFGEHLFPRRGVLARLPDSAPSLDLAKGCLLRASHGEGVLFGSVDYAAVRLLLLPDGDEVLSPGAACARARGLARPPASAPAAAPFFFPTPRAPRPRRHDLRQRQPGGAHWRGAL